MKIVIMMLALVGFFGAVLPANAAYVVDCVFCHGHILVDDPVVVDVVEEEDVVDSGDVGC